MKDTPSAHKLSTLIQSYIERRIKSGESRAVTDCRRIALRRLLEAVGDCEPASVTRRQMKAWQTDLLGLGLSHATVNHQMSYASAFFRDLEESELIEANPCHGIRVLRVPRGRETYLTPEEVRRLLDAADPWFRDILTLALHTGVRKGNLCQSLKADVDLDRAILTIPLTKNGDIHHAPLDSEALEVVRRLVAGNHHEYLLSGPEGKPLAGGRSAQGYRNGLLGGAWERTVRAAGLEEVRGEKLVFHSLRHVFCSTLASCGVLIEERALLAGHRRIEMQRRYTHFEPGFLADSIRKLEGVW